FDFTRVVPMMTSQDLLSFLASGLVAILDAVTCVHGVSSLRIITVVRARSKKWLCAEEAPTYCGSRGQLSTTSHFSKVIGMSNPSLMACGLIKTPFTLYHVDTYARSSLFLDGDDGPFHLLTTIFSYKDRVTLVKYCVDVRGLQQHCTQECIWIPKRVDF
ncbi:hypothetical protein V1477_008432, partial [Vespula maculifrons]